MSLSACQRISPTLDQLPADIIAHIVFEQLTEITGSKEILNEKDIPVIMRNVTNVSLTCKTLYQTINSQEFTQMFLEIVAKKFQKSQAYIAAMFDTPGARQWLWSYTNQKGYQEAYDTIQDIYELTATILKQAEKARLDFNASEGRKGWPSPNPYYSQTQRGFFLLGGSTPSRLATPFGEVMILGSCSGRGDGFLAITEMFVRRLKATFAGLKHSGIGRSEEDYRIIPVSDNEDDTFSKISYNESRRVTKSELEGQKGKQVLVMSSYSETQYAIQRVKERSVAAGTWSSTKREYETVKMMWEMLEKQRLGQDPLRKKIIKKEPSHSSREPVKSDLQGISQHAIDLVNQLTKQPIFPEKRWISSDSRVLPLKSYGEARGVELLNQAAKQFLAKDASWHIHAYGCGNNQISLKGKDLGNGLDLWLPKNHKPCDLHTLKAAYDRVLTSVGAKWEKARLIDFPNILLRESEEDYFLFVKKQRMFPEEDVLISSIAYDLGIAQYVHSHSHWKGEGSRGVYLWIKKDKFEQVSKALQLNC